jgi:hypothetical protein
MDLFLTDCLWLQTPVPPCPAPPPAPCDAHTTQGSCVSPCLWKGGACTNPPLPPTPPALCAKQTLPKGFKCSGDTCGGDVPSSGANCGTFLLLPNLTCTDNCALLAAAACEKEPKCESFSLFNPTGGSGASKAQLFAGGGTCRRRNKDWSTWTKATDGDDGETAAATGVDLELSSGGPSLSSSSIEGAYTGSRIHTSTSPDGPFVPLHTTFPGCNTPSPYIMANDTIVVLCTWSILAADSLEGPWRTILPHLTITVSSLAQSAVAREALF